METQFVTALKSFFTKFQENPFQFLTERDIQSSLYSQLCEEEQYKTPIILKTPLFKKWGGPENVLLPHVTTEYHYFYGNEENCHYSSYDRMDIAILNSDESLDIDQINNHTSDVFTNESLWIHPVKIGIELKLSSTLNYPNTFELKQDLEKLSNYYYKYSITKKLKGIAVCFCYTDHVLKEHDFEEIKLNDFEKSFSDNIDYYSFIVMKSKIYRGIF